MNRLLFLCSGNYYRSRYAEEVFNHRARAAAVDWWADSRGLRLNPRNIGPIAQVVLHRLASLEVIPTNAHRNPEAVAESDLAASDLLVAMSREEHYLPMKRMFPVYAEQTVYWDVQDTGWMSPEVALQRIESLVDRLIDDLRTHGSPGQFVK